MPITMMRTPKISIALPTIRMTGSLRDSTASKGLVITSSPWTVPATPGPWFSPTWRARSRLRSLLCLHARRDGGDDARCHLELVFAVFDPVSPRDPVKIGIGSPYFPLLVLVNEKPHRPIESGIGVGGDELRAKRRVSEDQQYGRSKLDACISRQLGLIDLIEELDAFVGNVFLQTLNGLADGIGAFHRDDAIVAGQDRRRGGQNGCK